MELWIRSQDREILRVNPELEIYEYGKENFLVLDTKSHTSYDKAKILGRYKNKTRALEILDEIQKILEPKMIIKAEEKPFEPKLDDAVLKINSTYETVIPLENIVYKMPEE